MRGLVAARARPRRSSVRHAASAPDDAVSADIQRNPDPDFGMTRALLPIAKGVLLTALAAAPAIAAAGGAPREGERRTTNSFSLIYSATAPEAPKSAQSNGVGVGPSKPVVSNPYNVPLLQNAGSLRSSR
jgi:hypothetical protein